MQGMGDRAYMMKGKQHDTFFHHTLCVAQSWSQHFWDLCHCIRSPRIRQCVSLRTSLGGHRLISHPLDHVCYDLLFVVCYCTFITQIYDHHFYKFGWLFILPSLVSLWLTLPGISHQCANTCLFKVVHISLTLPSLVKRLVKPLPW